jgi:hypothetical protein
MRRQHPINTSNPLPRNEKTPRNQTAAVSAFLGKKAEIDEMIARLANLSADHFNSQPHQINWGDVGTLEHYASLLRRITDSAFKEDEHAE